MQIADDRIDADHRLALERENRAEHAVSGRMLRPHVHREALAASVSDFERVARRRVWHAYLICRRGAFAGLPAQTRLAFGCGSHDGPTVGERSMRSFHR